MVCCMGAEPADGLLWLMCGGNKQTEEKDELPALWRSVCMREKEISNYQSVTGVTSVISLPICLCNIQSDHLLPLL